MLEAILVYQCLTDDDAKGFKTELSSFEKRHPDFQSNPQLWACQLRQALEEKGSSFGQ